VDGAELKRGLVKILGTRGASWEGGRGGCGESQSEKITKARNGEKGAGKKFFKRMLDILKKPAFEGG